MWNNLWALVWAFVFPRLCWTAKQEEKRRQTWKVALKGAALKRLQTYMHHGSAQNK